MNVLISIVVPVYNVELYIDECLKSIRNQTYKKIEIIVVDDGSSDMSLEKCNKHASEDDRIVVIHQDNKGLCNAKKTGIKHATGQYIGFVDGDDYIDDNMYELLLASILNYDADIAHCGFKKNSENKSEFETEVIDFEKNRKLFIRKFFEKKLFFNPGMPLKLYRQQVLLELYLDIPDQIKVSEDTAFLFRCLNVVNRISFISETPYYYRTREGSLTNNNSAKTLIDKMKSCEYIRDMVINSQELSDMIETCDRYIISETIRYTNIITSNRIPMVEFRIKNISEFRNRRIILFGAGKVGRSYYMQLCMYKDINVVAWVDTFYSNYDYDYMKVTGIEDAKKKDYDYIVIAIKNERSADEIRHNLLAIGIDDSKIYWEQPITYI